jgi:hypothetical protein
VASFVERASGLRLISRQFRLIEDLDGISAAYRPIDRLIRQQILAFSINFSDCGSITGNPEVIPKRLQSLVFGKLGLMPVAGLPTSRKPRAESGARESPTSRMSSM